jgi:heptosyltransferase-2
MSLGQLKRILVVRTDRVGDVVLTLPMLPFLKRCCPNVHIAMLLRKYTAELVEGNPYVDEIILYDDGKGLIPLKEMLQTLRAKEFDAAIVVYPAPRLAWLMFRARIPIRIGSGYRYYSFLLNRRVYEHRKDAKRHELEYNLNLLRELNCSAGGKPEFSLYLSPQAESVVGTLFTSLGIDTHREVVILHPGTGGSAKEWPAAFFGRLAGRLHAERGAQIIVTGRRGEERKVAEVLLGTQGKGIPLVDRLSLKELAVLIKRASLFVSNSTGPMHIAAAVGTPVVSLFPQIPAMSAARWGPYATAKRVLTPNRPVNCSECMYKKDIPCACMMSISIDDVYRAACSLLDEVRRKNVAHAQ